MTACLTNKQRKQNAVKYLNQSQFRSLKRDWCLSTASFLSGLIIWAHRSSGTVFGFSSSWYWSSPSTTWSNNRSKKMLTYSSFVSKHGHIKILKNVPTIKLMQHWYLWKITQGRWDYSWDHTQYNVISMLVLLISYGIPQLSISGASMHSFAVLIVVHSRQLESDKENNSLICYTYNHKTKQ